MAKLENALDYEGLKYYDNKSKEYINEVLDAAISNTAEKNHTHNYAGSSSAGGAATSALKLSNTTPIGSATQPVYFNASGVPVACTYTLGKSVPSNAVFTDNDYRVTITETNPSGGMWLYPTFHTAVSGTQQQLGANDGLSYYSLQGTTTNAGRTLLAIGNSKATGTAGNKYGELRIYSTSSGQGTISQAATTEALSHVLPTTGGTILNSGTTSFTQTLTTGTKIGAIKINGTSTDIYAPTNTDTHYTTGLVVGASATATANAAATNGNVYLNVMDNTTVRNAHKITGSGATTVTSDASGNITISSTNTTYSNFVKSGSGAKAGLVPAPSTTAGTTKYLREDGTWQIPPNTDTKVTVQSPGETTSGTTYYPTYSASINGSQVILNGGGGFEFFNQAGTTSANGISRLTLGLPLASGTAGNKYGELRIYSDATGAGIITQESTNTNVTHILPEVGGFILNETNYADFVTASSIGAAAKSHTHTNYMLKSNPTGTGSFSLNRLADSTVGEYSTTEGYNCTASGYSAHAEGYETTATGTQAHAEGCMSDATNNYAHAEGYDTTASGNGSHAEGKWSVASGEASHAEGYSTDATATGAHAEGSNALAEGNYSHAEGYYTTASGLQSHAEGCGSDATGEVTHASGRDTIASNFGSTAIGKFNKAMTDGGAYNTQVGDVFAIGNGSSTSARSNAFRVTYTGASYGLSAFNSSGADYAEFVYPWYDDNTNNEDRVGYFVTFKDGKLYKATSTDVILGVTSGNPSIIGNADEDYYWKYERDEFNRIIWEDVEEEIEVFDEEGNRTTEKTGNIIKNCRMKLNPDYDPSLQSEYIERKDRAEWDYVGMVGMLPVHDDGTCVPGQYCKCNDEGIATLATAEDVATNRFTYIVLERVSDNVVKILK